MLNDAQNRKLIGKLKRALEVFEPYVFTKIAQLPYTCLLYTSPSPRD